MTSSTALPTSTKLSYVCVSVSVCVCVCVCTYECVCVCVCVCLCVCLLRRSLDSLDRFSADVSLNSESQKTDDKQNGDAAWCTTGKSLSLSVSLSFFSLFLFLAI